jgi:NADPH:quinone reductase-like Zn-dependent oxidoreductase
MAVRTMHAVRAHARGGPETLVYEDAPRPEPAAGEALLAVHAAAVTPDELRWDATWTDSFDGTGRPRLPVIPSHEVAGVVAGTGPGVADVAVGEEVYGLIPFTYDGAAAEYVSLPADVLAAKPGNLDFAAAAALPLPALTAWQALMVHAGVRPGQHVLVHGAAGGVGTCAVQIAAAVGAQVIATASTPDRAFVAGLGAAEVVDYRTQRFEDHARDVDVVLDIVGGDTQERSWRVLRPGGVLVSVAAPVDSGQAKAHRSRGVFFIVEPDRTHLRQITRLVEAGRLAPVVDRTLPLADTRAAYEALEHAHRRGKIVISVAAP